MTHAVASHPQAFEIPTIWLDRTEGASNFKVLKWLPKYLRWYRFAFGGRLTLDQLVAKTTDPATTQGASS